MPKGKGKSGTSAKPGTSRVVHFTPHKVTKGAIRFAEATATGKPKVQSKSVWRSMYARLFDAEGGLGDYLDDEGFCTIKGLKVTIEIEE
jgi:hypothetical protein